MMLLIVTILPGCNEIEEEVDIYASIYPVYFLTDYIVKDKLVVKQVYPFVHNRNTVPFFLSLAKPNP